MRILALLLLFYIAVTGSCSCGSGQESGPGQTNAAKADTTGSGSSQLGSPSSAAIPATALSSADSIRGMSGQTGDARNNPALRKIASKKEIAGVWASGDQDALTTIDIRRDSIYYTEHFESYYYALQGDSIFIKYPDFNFSGRIYFIRDTLILESETGVTRFYRFK